MNFFKKKYILRRYSKPKYVRGRQTSGHKDIVVELDIQTLEDASEMTVSGSKSKQRIKTFGSSELIIAEQNGVLADRVFFQDKWFECVSSRLSENTILRHYTSEFIEIPKTEQDSDLKPPKDIIKGGRR